MTIYYSDSAKGFFDTEVNSVIPSDAIEITEVKHQELLDGVMFAGKIIVISNKIPVLQDAPPPTPEQEQAIVNRENQVYLNSTDWYVVRKAETGKEIPQDISDAREAARLAIK